jgi:CubicO group peptidase (beta-lactamase class C family)
MSRHRSSPLISARTVTAAVALAASLIAGWHVAFAAKTDAPTPSKDTEAPAPKPIPDILDELVPRLMKTHHVPGVSIAAVEDRRVTWHRCYGVRRAGTADKVDRDTVFEACSMTKPVFAYVAMKLVEQHQLDLDRPLCEYLDKPYIADAPQYKLITMRMVLSHCTGFPNWREGSWQKGDPLPVLFKPGTKFGYSGEGFLYLQRVVEHITGVPAEQYVRQKLFTPLGMTISSLVWEDRFEKLAAAGHDEQGKVKPSRHFREANAGFSLYCTPHEYALFLAEVLKQDRSAEQSLSSRTLDAMFTRTTKAPSREPISRGGQCGSQPVYWGLGWPIDHSRAGDRIYHCGTNGTGFCCYSEFDRSRGSAIVIMTNSLSGEKLWRAVIDAIAEP